MSRSVGVGEECWPVIGQRKMPPMVEEFSVPSFS